MNEKLKAYKNTKNIQNTDKNPHEIVKYLLENFIICIDNVFTDIETEMDKKNTLEILQFLSMECVHVLEV